MNKIYVSPNKCEFYEDGTYIRPCGTKSWWMRDEKGISVRHGLGEDNKWLALYSQYVGETDKRVNKELIHVLDTLIVEEFLLGDNRLDI